jgi:hypothetical protein
MANIVIGQNYFVWSARARALGMACFAACGGHTRVLSTSARGLRVQPAPGVSCGRLVSWDHSRTTRAHGAARCEVAPPLLGDIFGILDRPVKPGPSPATTSGEAVTLRSLIIDSETAPESSLILSAGRPRATEPLRKARDKGCLSSADHTLICNHNRGAVHA